MDYRTLPPAEPISRWVECYWSLTGGPAPSEAPERILPDGCAEVILNLAAPLRTDDAASSTGTPVVAGQLDRYLEVEPAGRVDLVGVRFHPAAARALLRVPQHELTEQVVPVADLRPGLAKEMRSRLGDAVGFEGRKRALDRILLDRLPGAAPPDPLVEGAVSRLLAAGGAVRVGRLAAIAGLSARQLERRFRAAVGIGPKHLARILRFQTVLAAMEEEGDVHWATAALACGYADQSHLIREFRHFSGRTPARFRDEEGEVAWFFSRTGRMSDSSKTGRG